MVPDILFREAAIYDGLGNPPVYGDVGVSGDKIVFPVEKSDASKSKRVIDASGLAVSPGFINIHSHSDEAFLLDGSVPSCVRQGITTEVTGNCGSSLAPLKGEYLEEAKRDLKRNYDIDITWNDFEGYFKLVESKGTSVNVMSLAGHGAIRGSVVGMGDREPSPAEIEQMKAELETSLRQGACGLSTGLIYPPGSFSKTPELTELAKTANKTGGIYTSHIRGEGDTLFPALEEAIKIGRETGIPVEISHLKASGRRNWGKTVKALEMLDNARHEGLFIRHDQYPYTASCTGLNMMAPDWTFDGGNEAFIARLKDPATREKIKNEMASDNYSDGHSVLISCVINPEFKRFEGMTVEHAAKQEGKNVFDFVIDLLIADDGATNAIYMSMNEDDVRRVMVSPWTCFGTDATAVATEGPLFWGKPHPRSYGTFPRVLGYYCRDIGLFSLSEAVRKMTSLPAEMLGLKDRGIISGGMAADLVMFDPAKIADTATYAEPHRYPVGIKFVLVNGEIVLEDCEAAKARPGRVIRNRRLV